MIEPVHMTAPLTTPNTMVQYWYQYFPIEKEINQVDSTIVIQWFVIDITNKSLSNISHTNDTCKTLPQDVYPVTQLNDSNFRIETSDTIIYSKTNFIQDLVEYISFMPKLISTLIFSITTNLLSKPQFTIHRTRLVFISQLISPDLIRKVEIAGLYLYQIVKSSYQVGIPS